MDECYLCLRITSEKILEIAKLVTDTEKEAKKLAMEAYEVIPAVYKENPTLLCGRSAKIIIAGLFYIIGFSKSKHISFQKLKQSLSVTPPSVNGAYRILLKSEYVRKRFGIRKLERDESLYSRFSNILYKEKEIEKFRENRKRKGKRKETIRNRYDDLDKSLSLGLRKMLRKHRT